MTMNESRAIGLEQAWKDGKMLDDFSFEEGWEVIHKGITKLKNVLEGLPEPPFSSKDYMMLYTIIYTMCTQKHNLSFGYSEQLYNKYRETHEEYITSKVLPSLREKEGEFMLKELVKRWGNHKVMVKSLCHCFRYLDRFYVLRRSLQPLTEAGITCFRDLVYTEFNGKVMEAVISLIDREREGEQIDQALLNNVKDIFVEIGMRDMSYYENDFEAPMLKDTAAYYSRKASNPDCVLNVEECLEREKERVSHYLHSNSEPKLLEEVRNVLLSKNSGDAKEEHLSKENADLTAQVQIGMSALMLKTQQQLTGFYFDLVFFFFAPEIHSSDGLSSVQNWS